MGRRRLAQSPGPASDPVAHHAQDSMRRARCSQLPTLGSKAILITRACSPTPLRGHEIIAILADRIGSIAFSIYRGGAADAQLVSPLCDDNTRSMYRISYL
jgi:hypothetical protein